MTSTLRIGMQLHQAGQWLGPEMLGRVDQALTAHEARNFTEAVAQTAQCLERLLKEWLTHWEVAVSGAPALGPLIGTVEKSGKAPAMIVERLNQANRIRNIALHDKPMAKVSTATEGDSLLLLQIFALSVEWYGGLVQAGNAVRMQDAMPVFLSVGGPHRLDQEQFLSRLRGEMSGLGVELRTVMSGEYSSEKPFDQIRDMMVTCRASLVLGLDRTHAYALFERENSDRETLHSDQYVPTAWNQIEGAMASALGLPILVLMDRRLHREGIFEAGNHRHRIREFDLPAECRGLSSELREFLAGWVQHLRSTSPRQ